MISLSSLFKNFETFSVGAPQLEITGLLETLYSLLWIFGIKYIFPNLKTFLWFVMKYLSSFIVVFHFFFKLLKLSLLVSARSCKILLLKLISGVEVFNNQLLFCLSIIIVVISHNTTVLIRLFVRQCSYHWPHFSLIKLEWPNPIFGISNNSPSILLERNSKLGFLWGSF